MLVLKTFLGLLIFILPLAQALGQNFTVERMPPIYREILEEFENTYAQIGDNKAQEVLKSNGKLQIKGLNHLGFTWAKDFSTFSVDIKRDVQPDIFHDTRWIVSDEISLSISASKLLDGLDTQALAEIDRPELAAFAGLHFTRVHRNIHFADSFSNAMTASYKYLFLGFLPFYNGDLKTHGEHLLSTREDYFSVAAGGVVRAPLTSSLSASAALLARYERVSKTSIESYQFKGVRRLKLSYEKSKIKSLKANMALYLAFANILKMTLLSYDYNYSMGESKRYNLDFSRAQLHRPELNQQIQRILRGKNADLSVIAPFVQSSETKHMRQQASQFKFLLWSREKDEKTEQVKIVKDGIEKNFFKHQFTNIKYRDGLWSTIFAALLDRQIGENISVEKKQWHKKSFFLEYASQKNFLKTAKPLPFPLPEELSLKFNFAFKTAKKTKKLIRLMTENTTLAPSLLHLMGANGLNPPFLLSGQSQLGPAAWQEFTAVNASHMHRLVQGLCAVKGWKKGRCERKVWSPYEKYIVTDLGHKKIKKALRKCRRKKWLWARFFNKFRSSAKRSQSMQTCLSRLDQKYNTHPAAVKTTSLNSLKTFLQVYYNYADNLYPLEQLFGAQNIFHHGSFKAFTKNQEAVTIYYKRGEFQGLGAIANYRLELLDNSGPPLVMLAQ